MRIISWEADCLYTMEYYQKLKEQFLFVIGCDIYILGVAGVISLF